MLFTIHSFCYNCQIMVITGLSQSKACVNSKKTNPLREILRPVDPYNVVVSKLISNSMVIFTDLFHGYTDTKVILTAYEHLITPLLWSRRPLFWPMSAYQIFRKCQCLNDLRIQTHDVALWRLDFMFHEYYTIFFH